MIRSNKIRNAARGEQCTVQIVGTCSRNPETVVFAHLPDPSHGMALKASDHCGVFACSNCHDMLEGRTKPSTEFREFKDWYLRMAYQRTVARLFEIGVVRIA